jgi:hypothetical protein
MELYNYKKNYNSLRTFVNTGKFNPPLQLVQSIYICLPKSADLTNSNMMLLDPIMHTVLQYFLVQSHLLCLYHTVLFQTSILLTIFFKNISPKELRWKNLSMTRNYNKA